MQPGSPSRWGSLVKAATSADAASWLGRKASWPAWLVARPSGAPVVRHADGPSVMGNWEMVDARARLIASSDQASAFQASLFQSPKAVSMATDRVHRRDRDDRWRSGPAHEHRRGGRNALPARGLAWCGDEASVVAVADGHAIGEQVRMPLVIGGYEVGPGFTWNPIARGEYRPAANADLHQRVPEEGR